VCVCVWLRPCIRAWTRNLQGVWFSAATLLTNMLGLSFVNGLLVPFFSIVTLQLCYGPGLGHADLANRLVPTLVPRQLLGGARMGRCHVLLEELAPSPWGRTGGWAPVRGRGDAGGAGEAGGGALWMEGGRVLFRRAEEFSSASPRGGGGAADGWRRTRGGGVRDFSGG
jgi:hypothetical protein